MSGFFVKWEQRPTCLHGHDHIPVAHNCHAFYHCWGPRLTIKHCGPFLMFNPVTKVCDWPSVVKYIRPMCDPYHKPAKNELKRVDLIKPTVTELGSSSFISSFVLIFQQIKYLKNKNKLLFGRQFIQNISVKS